MLSTSTEIMTSQLKAGRELQVKLVQEAFSKLLKTDTCMKVVTMEGSVSWVGLKLSCISSTLINQIVLEECKNVDNYTLFLPDVSRVTLDHVVAILKTGHTDLYTMSPQLIQEVTETARMLQIDFSNLDHVVKFKVNIPTFGKAKKLDIKTECPVNKNSIGVRELSFQKKADKMEYNESIVDTEGYQISCEVSEFNFQIKTEAEYIEPIDDAKSFIKEDISSVKQDFLDIGSNDESVKTIIKDINILAPPLPSDPEVTNSINTSKHDISHSQTSNTQIPSAPKNWRSIYLWDKCDCRSFYHSDIKKQQLNAHTDEVKNNSNHDGSKSNKGTTTVDSDLNSVKSKNHFNKPGKCNRCYVNTFSSFSIWKKRMFSDHMGGEFRFDGGDKDKLDCNFCRKKFKNQYNVRKHMLQFHTNI